MPFVAHGFHGSARGPKLFWRQDLNFWRGSRARGQGEGAEVGQNGALYGRFRLEMGLTSGPSGGSDMLRNGLGSGCPWETGGSSGLPHPWEWLDMQPNLGDCVPCRGELEPFWRGMVI